MFAVIAANGFQYVVKKGERITIPAIIAETGKEVVFDKVLMIKSEKDTLVGKPYLSGAKVTGTVKKTGRLDKVVVFKFIRRESYRRKRGHRQDFSEIEITGINR